MRKLPKIKSRDNEKLKFARRVRDGREDGYMFVEGSRLCGECLRSDIEIVYGLVSDESVISELAEGFEQNAHFPIYSVSEKLLGSVADTMSPQGIVLIAKRPTQILTEELFERLDASLPVIVYLYRINNPSNLGAIIRTAEAAGVAGVIVSENSADVFSPKSLRASMGSAFRLRAVTDVSVEELVNAAGMNDIPVVAVDVGGTVSHTDYNWQKRTVLVFGSEAGGLSKEILSRADAKLKIEMNSEVESLNLAVSCGIVLFEARRQLTG